MKKLNRMVLLNKLSYQDGLCARKDKKPMVKGIDWINKIVKSKKRCMKVCRDSNRCTGYEYHFKLPKP